MRWPQPQVVSRSLGLSPARRNFGVFQMWEIWWSCDRGRCELLDGLADSRDANGWANRTTRIHGCGDRAGVGLLGAGRWECRVTCAEDSGK